MARRNPKRLSVSVVAASTPDADHRLRRAVNLLWETAVRLGIDSALRQPDQKVGTAPPAYSSQTSNPPEMKIGD